MGSDSSHSRACASTCGVRCRRPPHTPVSWPVRAPSPGRCRALRTGDRPSSRPRSAAALVRSFRWGRTAPGPRRDRQLCSHGTHGLLHGDGLDVVENLPNLIRSQLRDKVRPRRVCDSRGGQAAPTRSAWERHPEERSDQKGQQTEDWLSEGSQPLRERAEGRDESRSGRGQ